MRGIVHGSIRFAEPIFIAAFVSHYHLSTSSTLWIPPQLLGSFTAWNTSFIMRWAIGLMVVNPDRPAYFIAVTVVLVLRSILIALVLLIKLIHLHLLLQEGLCNLSNIGYIWSKLHKYQQFCNISDGSSSPLSHTWIKPNADPPCSTLGHNIHPKCYQAYPDVSSFDATSANSEMLIHLCW